MLKQLSVILCVLIIIILFIIPINTVLLDILIAVNIIFTIFILLKAITTESLVEFSSFPTLLLITTLYRLALTVSSTRLILGELNAGEIIETFGNFAAKGNIVIGGVIFLIVTIVNFVVITKGSERIGEVSSRFFLDALPGRQISIDSDLKSGLINEAQAKEKRVVLDSESQIFSSLDGTMKFVKGDAIAGIIIIMVNIFGGLLVGNLYHGLSFSESLELFTILTIGDGLVSQIPALIISIGAAIIVSRVMEEDSQPLGIQVVKQLFSDKTLSYIVAICCLVLSLVPGMPHLIFMGISFVIVISSILSRYIKVYDSSTKMELMKAPILIRFPGKSTVDKKIVIENIELETFSRFGIILTKPVLVNSDDHYSLSFMGYSVPCPFIYGKKYKYHVEHKDEIENKIEKDNELDSFLIGNKKVTETNNNDKKHSTENIFFDWVTINIIQNIKKNFGIQETRYLLDYASINNPELVYEVTTAVEMNKLSEILRRLVGENVPLLNIKEILSSIFYWSKKEEDELLLVELVRIDIKERICADFLLDGALHGIVLCKETTSLIDGSIIYDNSGVYVDVSPEFKIWIKNKVREFININMKGVVVVDTQIRRFVWSIINSDAMDIDQIAVLSHHEVSNFKVIGECVLNDFNQV